MDRQRHIEISIRWVASGGDIGILQPAVNSSVVEKRGDVFTTFIEQELGVGDGLV